MIYFVSFFSFFVLWDASEFFCELATGSIFRIEWMNEICMFRIFSCPWDKCLVDFACISLSMLPFSYPDTDIDLSRFESPESSTPEKSSSIFIKDEILKFFSFLDLVLCISHEFKLLLIYRKKWTHIEILIRLAEFLGKFTDIDSSIGRKRHKYTSGSFDMRSRKVEMRIF